MSDIIFLTGNADKLKTALDAIEGYNISLLNQKIDLPEIQSLDVEEVAKFSAKYGSDKLKKDVIVTDVGYYFSALNGFPGPFIKFLNKTLSSSDILSLMANHVENREVIIKECLSYCPYMGEPITFISTQKAKLSMTESGDGSPIDNVLILDGFDITVGSMDKFVLEGHWKKHLSHYEDFAQYVEKVSVKL